MCYMEAEQECVYYRLEIYAVLWGEKWHYLSFFHRLLSLYVSLPPSLSVCLL